MKRKPTSDFVQVISDDDDPAETTNTAVVTTLSSTSEDGEIDEATDANDEEGELTVEGERALLDAAISKDVKAGGKDVAQKDIRYFMMDNVVCNNCGVKGHLSYDCPEKEEKMRCFLCGTQGHNSKECPKEVCYKCQTAGHRARDCPVKGGGLRQPRKRREPRRNLRPARPPKLSCYVCGGNGHLDCGLSKLTPGVLSCYNCGMAGHAGPGCHMTSVDRIIPIVMEMERERKQKKQEALKQKREKRKKRRKKQGDDDEGGDSNSDIDMEEKKDEYEIAKEYRESILDRARERRYGRRTSGGPSK